MSHPLEELLGPDPAAILMEHLPPVGWGDVATKRDLDQHAAVAKRDLDRLHNRIDAVEERLGPKTDSAIDQLRAETDRLARRLVMWVSSMILAGMGFAFAAGRFGL